MARLNLAIPFVLSACLSAALPSVAAQQPDNTAQNKDQSVTADKQSNSKEDVHTSAQIRKAIMADKDLLTYAHNIKIVTRNGTVTLKGPVNSEDEKQKIEADAATVVSSQNIVDQLTVKPQQ